MNELGPTSTPIKGRPAKTRRVHGQAWPHALRRSAACRISRGGRLRERERLLKDGACDPLLPVSDVHPMQHKANSVKDDPAGVAHKVVQVSRFYVMWDREKAHRPDGIAQVSRPAVARRLLDLRDPVLARCAGGLAERDPSPNA